MAACWLVEGTARKKLNWSGDPTGVAGASRTRGPSSSLTGNSDEGDFVSDEDDFESDEGDFVSDEDDFESDEDDFVSGEDELVSCEDDLSGAGDVALSSSMLSLLFLD